MTWPRIPASVAVFLVRVLAVVVLLQLGPARAWLAANETSDDIAVASDHLSFKISKVNGDLYDVLFDGTSLLGQRTSSTGRGYLICYCAGDDILSGSGEFSVGNQNTTTYRLTTSVDPTGTAYVGIYLLDTLPTGQTFEYWFFVRDDGSNAIHQWTRLTYTNATVPFLTKFGEYRYLFRPQASWVWTHLSTNEQTEAPLPSEADLESEVKVQDATWVFPNSTSAWTKAVGRFFTKYIFADNYDWPHKAHGIYADGSKTNGQTLGVWQLLNTRDTYYGGPSRYDLFVDGAVYNKWSTSHYGARQSNITTGFDRTFGPQTLYFNGNGTLASLRNDAYAKSTAWSHNFSFYDYVGEKYVPTYVRSAQRGVLRGSVKDVPDSTVRIQAVLAQNGADYAWNVQDQKAHQHWVDVDLETGEFEIADVANGTYRLTLKYDGVFGDYFEDDVVVLAGQTTERNGISYQGETHGEELWRIGIPDRTAGEFKHGFEPDPDHTSHIAQYRQVWQAYDFPTEFPSGINYTIGASSLPNDFNYIHWSSYGPTYDRPTIVTDSSINNVHINFHLNSTQAPRGASDNYTLTIALAGAKGSSIPPSFDSNNIGVDWSLADVELWTYVNDHDQGFRWWIWQGFQSSLGVRSGISGFNLVTYWSWSGDLLREGWNTIVLSLPENSTSYVQYDALRLEVARAANGTA